MKKLYPSKEREGKKKNQNFSEVKVSLGCSDCAVTAVNLLRVVTWIESPKRECVSEMTPCVMGRDQVLVSWCIKNERPVSGPTYKEKRGDY